MYHKVCTLISVASLLCFSHIAAATADVVKMPRFEVKEFRGYFEVQFETEAVTEKVKAGELVWVSPSITQKGLRRGDRIVSIDGKSITGFRLQEVIALLTLKAGDSRIVMLAGRRGFFRKQVTPQVTLTFIGEEKEPNKAPEPTR